MTRTKPWAQLRDKIEDTPERQVLAAQYRHAMDTAEALGRALDASAEVMNHSTDASYDSCITHVEDEYLSALRNYVDLLGGQLEITAVFPDRKVRLVPAEED